MSDVLLVRTPHGDMLEVWREGPIHTPGSHRELDVRVQDLARGERGPTRRRLSHEPPCRAPRLIDEEGDLERAERLAGGRVDQPHGEVEVHGVPRLLEVDEAGDTPARLEHALRRAFWIISPVGRTTRAIPVPVPQEAHAFQ